MSVNTIGREIRAGGQARYPGEPGGRSHWRVALQSFAQNNSGVRGHVPDEQESAGAILFWLRFRGWGEEQLAAATEQFPGCHPRLVPGSGSFHDKFGAEPVKIGQEHGGGTGQKRGNGGCPVTIADALNTIVRTRAPRDQERHNAKAKGGARGPSGHARGKEPSHRVAGRKVWFGSKDHLVNCLIR